MTKINDGLILPFRFYDNRNKQARYQGCGRYDADDIRHNEYLIVVGCKLLPFQIKRATNLSETLNLSVVNIHTDVETDLTSFVDSNDWDIQTIGGYDYISYYGLYDILDTGVCALDTCVYYAKFNDGVSTWYSELFKIVTLTDGDTYIREWEEGGEYREWNDGDLRVWTK